jgi:Zn-dependent protease
MRLEATVGRLAGVELRLHASFALIATLIAASLAAHFGATHPEWTRAGVWATAVLTAVLFFVTLVLHELSHALVARARGLPVHSITLFALGGVARIEREAADPATEFWMGIVGPITSALLGSALLAVAAVLGAPPGPSGGPAVSVLWWLGVINLSLAAFNMLPGFPLDGGRVLRALLWWATGDGARASRWAARLGQVVAFGLVLLGLVESFAGAGLSALWLVIVGWFLLGAAQNSVARTEAAESLHGLRVADLMTRDCEVVDENASLREFVLQHLLRTGRRCFVATSGGQVVGLLTPRELKGIDRSRWADIAVRDVMRPLRQLRTIGPQASLTESLDSMSGGDVHQLPVVQDGRLQGVITRGDILRVLRARTELQM